MRDFQETLLVKNASLLHGARLIKKNLLIEGSKIKKIFTKIPPSLNASETIDAEGLVLLPAAIDCHVHFRDSGIPGGFEYKEDWASGSRAAAAGGVATVIDMPNCIPPTTTVPALNAKRVAASKNSLVNYGFQFGAEAGNAREAERARNIASIKIFMGASTGTLLLKRDEEIARAFNTAKKIGRPACVHAEDDDLVKKFTENAKSRGSRDWNAARPPECGIVAVKRALALQEKIKNRLHVCHVTTAGELGLIKAAKKNRRVTCEATPHHLFLNSGDGKRLGSFGKMNPPLRERRDQAALWTALLDGTIDIVATDHAPHTRAEKEKDFWSAPAGVPGVETMLPLLLNAFNERKIPLQKIIELTAENPARVFGIKGKGFLREGFDADLVLVDLKKERKVRGEELHSKCGWTPFEGLRLKGWPVTTIIGGTVVFRNDGFNKKARGSEAVFKKLV